MLQPLTSLFIHSLYLASHTLYPPLLTRPDAYVSLEVSGVLGSVHLSGWERSEPRKKTNHILRELFCSGNNKLWGQTGEWTGQRLHEGHSEWFIRLLGRGRTHTDLPTLHCFALKKTHTYTLRGRFYKITGQSWTRGQGACHGHS